MCSSGERGAHPELASAFFLSQRDHSLSLSVSSIISIPELDLFGDLDPSSKQNGTKEPDAFDLDVLGEALTQPSKDTPARRTPESFLGPSASSLVNLDSLVKAPQAAKTRNPFLTGRTPPRPCWVSTLESPALSPSLPSEPRPCPKILALPYF